MREVAREGATARTMWAPESSPIIGRMPDFRPRDASKFHVGQRVSVREGELVAASLRKDGG